MKEGSKEGRKEGNPTRKDFLTPENGRMNCPKISARNYHYLLRNRKSVELNLRLIYNFFFTMLKCPFHIPTKCKAIDENLFKILKHILLCLVTVKHLSTLAFVSFTSRQ